MKTRLLSAGVALTLALALSAWPQVAAAQDDTKAAIEEYKKATTHYKLNEFDEAIKHYKEAYRLKADPAFLFNIGQSYRQKGDYDSATKFYRSYLRDAPNAANRAEVELKIDEMRKALEVRSTPPTDVLPKGAPGGVDDDDAADDDSDSDDDGGGVPDAGAAAQKIADQDTSTAPPRDGGGKPIYKKWWFWTGVGAVLIGGTVAIIAASSSDGGTSIPDSPLGSQRAF